MGDGEDAGTKGVRRPGQWLACGWCGAAVSVPWRGRTPKWCSQSCRTRAWAARRAVEAGDAEVRIVDRPIEVVREVRVEADPRSVEEWSSMLRRLANRVDDGRVYDRDLAQLLASVDELGGAIHRRVKRRELRRR